MASSTTSQNAVNYINNAEMKQWWLENIAPNFLEMEETNLYVTGVFGYVNEVIGTIMEDSCETVNAIRQEFYPSSAKYMKSLYKMATMQRLDLPMVTPATAQFILLIKTSDIIDNGTQLGDNEKDKMFFISNKTKGVVDMLVYMLDYPITISAFFNSATRSYTYSAQYNVDSKFYGNDLGDDSHIYTYSKVAYLNNTEYLLVQANCHQVDMQVVSEVIARGTSVQTIVMDIPYDGDLASFEVFYIENDSSKPVRLTKFLDGTFPSEPYFVNYTLVENKIRLSFPYNTLWMPGFNSELEVHVYTSDGEKGNFDSYNGTILFLMDAEDSTANLSVLASLNGESYGGMAATTKEAYRKKVIDAYSTNKTITTDSDIQTLFDEVKDDYNSVTFIKKRDDAFIRLFGAYMLLRDKNRFIVPTNTLDLFIPSDDSIFDGQLPETELTIRPGQVYEYRTSGEKVIPDQMVVSKVNDVPRQITDDLDDSLLLFSNPFLISFKRDPNIVGVYINSCEYTIPIAYSDVNEKVKFQWIVNYFKISRNSMAGEDFYKFSITCNAVIDQDDITFVIPSTETDSDYLIEALYDGEVTSTFYSEKVYSKNAMALPFHYTDYAQRTDTDEVFFRDDTLCNANEIYDVPTIIMEVRYDLGEKASPRYKYEYLQVSNGVLFKKQESNNRGYDYAITGYKSTYIVGDTFRKKNILGTKRPKDTANVRATLHLGNLNEGTDFYYIPMTVDDYEDPYITLSGYIRVDDFIGLSSAQSDYGEDEEITHVISGLYKYDSITDKIVITQDEDDPIDALVQDITSSFAIMVDFKDNNTTNNNTDIKGFDPVALGFDSFTWTNTYKHLNDETFDLITPVKYIRSSIDAVSGGYLIKELPVVKANWLKETANMIFFINKFRYNVSFLRDIYNSLDENFSFDIKFHNTYGISTCYKVIRQNNESGMLDRTDIKLNLGIQLVNNEISKETFKESLVAYLRDYIDSINSSEIYAPIYFMNLVSDIKNNFPEIKFIEYYGINDISENTVQRIEPISKINILKNEGSEYIPEYINIRYERINGEYQPVIGITFL